MRLTVISNKIYNVDGELVNSRPHAKRCLQRDLKHFAIESGPFKKADESAKALKAQINNPYTNHKHGAYQGD